MASIRKAKKLGIYKAPKYTKERAKIMADTRKLVSEANRRLKGLQNAGYGKGTWSSKKLANRIDTKTLKGMDKKGRIKVNKNLNNTQLLTIQKATRQFLASTTSKASGIEKVKKETKESLKASLSTSEKLSDLDVETAYEMLGNKDFDYFNNEDKVGASTLWALIEDAVEDYELRGKYDPDKFSDLLLKMYNSTNDVDAKEKANRLYEKYVL